MMGVHISGYRDGSVAERLNLPTIRGLPVPLAPRNEQDAISHILGSLDDQIELNRLMNETLQAMAQASFKSWFVDFDPVLAKTEGRQPVGIDPATASLFPDSFEDSPLGEIPRGWAAGTFTDLLDIGREIINPAEYLTEVFDHYSIPAFDEGRVPHAHTGEEIKSNKFLVQSSCVLLSKLNPRIRRVWLPAARHKRRAVCSTEFLVAQPRPGVPVEFLYCLLDSRSFHDVFTTLVTGTSGSHQRVRPEDLLSMVTLLPPIEVATRFAGAIRPMLQTIDCHLAESKTLASLRNTLLPKLLSGEVRVKASETLVSAAT
jgi:type I restriction enzyme S subunit